MATVALLQISTNETELVAQRIARVLDLIAQQKGKADFVVLPELWHVGAFATQLASKEQQEISGPLVEALSRAAREAQVWLHGGSFSERHAEGNSNTSVVFNPTGELVATYRKIHLFGFDRGEAVSMSAGNEFVLIPNTPLGTIGLATCYDLRFPELFRELTAMGAQTLLLTSGWPTPRINHWDILTQARAIENLAWLVACNEVGTHAGVTLGGSSCVIDPMGNVLAKAGSEEEVIYCEVDVEIADEWRESFPALKDRRI